MGHGRIKFILGGLFILAAITLLVVTSMKTNAEYFMTVDEVQGKGESLIGRKLRISGAVVGSTIRYDPETLNLSFEVADIPGDNAEVEAQGGLAAVLHEAVSDPAIARILVVYNGARPDLLRDEAQAVITGQLGEDGTFHADELLLKCPTKYEQAIPDQVEDV